MNKIFKGGLLFSVCAMAAAALGSCTADGNEAGGLQQSNTAVQVTATVAKSDLSFTRAADGLDTSTGFSLLTATNSSSKINIRVDDGSGSYTNYAYSLTGALAITAPATPPYFPAGVNSVNVYGWYPENGGSTTFTVQDNQQTDANYCLSDVMIAQPATSTRALSGTPQTWNVTAAALTFTHIMSKVKVTLDPVAGVTITQVKLKNAKKTVALGTTGSPVVTAVTVGDASGDAGDITLLSGGSITSSSAAADKVVCGVFPAQSISGDILEITASYGGLSNTITYTLSSAKAFASNQQYEINATVGIIRTNETVAIDSWTAAGNNPINVSVGSVTDPAAMRTGDCMALNPLYWVAQYNIKTIKGVTDPATSAAATATAFYTYHAIPANVFTFAHAGKLAENSTENTNYDAAATMANYHLPNRNEQVSVIPSNVTTGSGANIFAQNNTSAASPYIMEQIACKVHGTGVAACKSYFLKIAALDYYAVRFVTIGSENNYASAWHYKMVPGSGLTIESYMLATKPTTDAQAKEILAALPYSSAWEGTANEAPTTSSPTGTGLVRRFMPASGWKDGSSGVADRGIGVGAGCVSATADGSGCFDWTIASDGYLYESSYHQTLGRCVRLFRD
ncbi:MAG: fimbrillin family protein [Prevotella sp.]|nr:fimbrillin family protein [Prevotella sp.]